MSRVRSNLIYNVVYRVLILIVPFLTTPYVSRILHPQGIGLYSATTSIAKYFSMFAAMGMSTYANRLIAQNKDESDKLNYTFSSLFRFQWISALIWLALYLVYIRLDGDNRYGVLMFCQLPYLLATMLDVSWYFAGTEQFKTMVKRNTVLKLLTLIAVFAFVKKAEDVWIYCLINASSGLIGQLMVWPVVHKQVHIVPVRKEDVWAHLKPNLLLFVSVLSVSVYTLADKIMLDTLSTSVQTGYYENADKLVNICINIIGAMGAVLFPRVSYLVQKKDEQKAREYFAESMHYMGALAIAMSFGIAAIAPPFSLLYFGREFAQCGILIAMEAPIIFFYTWENIVRLQYLFPHQLDRIFVQGTIIAAIANLICNALLIPRYGAIGAVAGTVLAQTTAAVYQSWRIRKQISFGSYMRYLIPFVGLGAGMFIVCRWIGEAAGYRIMTLLIEIIAGIFIYTAGSALIFHWYHDPFFNRILSRKKKE